MVPSQEFTDTAEQQKSVSYSMSRALAAMTEGGPVFYCCCFVLALLHHQPVFSFMVFVFLCLSGRCCCLRKQGANYSPVHKKEGMHLLDLLGEFQTRKCYSLLGMR